MSKMDASISRGDQFTWEDPWCRGQRREGPITRALAQCTDGTNSTRLGVAYLLQLLGNSLLDALRDNGLAGSVGDTTTVLLLAWCASGGVGGDGVVDGVLSGRHVD